MRRVIIIIGLLWPAPASAQVEVVAAVKADLVQRGVSLDGPCGAFQITRRVAWQLRHTSAGLLYKPGGNRCEDFSVDFLTYPDGSGIDILGDAGDANTPTWQMSEPPGALLGRWRAPTNPDPVVEPPPTPEPPQLPPDLAQQIQQLTAQLAAHEAEQAQFRAEVRSAWKEALAFVGKYIAPALIAFYGGKAVS